MHAAGAIRYPLDQGLFLAVTCPNLPSPLVQPVVLEPGSLSSATEYDLTAWAYTGDLSGDFLLSNPRKAPATIVAPTV